MAKYTEKLGKKIAEAIEQDEYTLGEICSIHNISRKTFYQWIIKYPDFEGMVENARLERDERLAQKAVRYSSRE
ncbi:helix-turn-helix domain-containing protein [Dysgonomonas capnocytophagoides]|uniref:helix-turn-helix domain-containing protein n=1 Tax=Dysgonomonas capnocytophagoides TaxID=45254 RepID=UPI003994BC05